MDWNRLLSLVVAVSYLVVLILGEGFHPIIFPIAGLLVFCLACLSFGDDIGGYIGPGPHFTYIISWAGYSSYYQS